LTGIPGQRSMERLLAVTEIIKLTMVLTFICVVSAIVIVFTDFKTRDQILLKQQELENKALIKVTPAGYNFTRESRQFSECPDQYWIGTKGADTVYIFRIMIKGYSSLIKYLVCVDKNGTINGMTILSQTETPGLGARIQEVTCNKFIWTSLFKKREPGSPWFTRQFKDLSITKDINIETHTNEWHKLDNVEKVRLRSRNSVTAITGATITTSAIVRGIESQARAHLKALRG
jgi:electron transport complex protein RnfG